MHSPDDRLDDEDSDEDDGPVEESEEEHELRLLGEAAEELFAVRGLLKRGPVTDGLWTLVPDEDPWVLGADEARRAVRAAHADEDREAVSLEDVITLRLGAGLEQDGEPECTQALTVLGPVLCQIAGRDGLALSLRVQSSPDASADGFLMALVGEHLAYWRLLALRGGPPAVRRTARRRLERVLRRPRPRPKGQEGDLSK